MPFPGPTRSISFVLNKSVVHAGARKCSVWSGDRRRAGGRLPRQQGRQEVRVEDRAGAMPSGMDLEIGVVLVPELAHAVGDEQPAAAVEHGNLGAALHLAPDGLAALARRRFEHRVGEVFANGARREAARRRRGRATMSMMDSRRPVSHTNEIGYTLFWRQNFSRASTGSRPSRSSIRPPCA